MSFFCRVGHIYVQLLLQLITDITQHYCKPFLRQCTLVFVIRWSTGAYWLKRKDDQWFLSETCPLPPSISEGKQHILFPQTQWHKDNSINLLELDTFKTWIETNYRWTHSKGTVVFQIIIYFCVFKIKSLHWPQNIKIYKLNHLLKVEALYTTKIAIKVYYFTKSTLTNIYNKYTFCSYRPYKINKNNTPKFSF